MYDKAADRCCPFAMSNARDATRALNSLFQEGCDLYGSSDGPALSDFVQEFFCGDDPIDSDGEWNACVTIPYFTELSTIEEEVEEQFSNFNGKI